ncbi:hypothetical protein FRC17_005023 [Serendipita sp. 399]|nr:hypothetical protein FRC17_005023 [Serendipita sp. 399]
MPLLSTLIASSAVAISLLSQAALPVNALAAPAHALVPRHASPGVSPNHHGLKRKRNAHKHRKRCVAQNNGVVPTPSSSAVTNVPTNSGNNNNGGNTGNNNNNNNNGGSYNPNPGAVCAGGKVGFAWAPDVDANWMGHLKTGKTCFYYNWSSWPANPDVTSGLRFVPMYWGPKANHDEEFRSNVIYNDNWYGFAMAMNEVNQAGQSQMDPWYGAQLWRDMLLPLRWNKHYTLISPSTTSADDGIPWLQTWMGLLADNEKPDVMAIHWYGKSLEDMKNYLTNFHNTFGRTVWVTEFACTGFNGDGCNDDINYFAQAADDWLSAQDWIGAYFPFGFVNNLYGVHESSRAINPWDGSVTSVGAAFLY